MSTTGYAYALSLTSATSGAYRNTSAVMAEIAKSPEVLVQATGWRRNAQGKIELFADKFPTQAQQPLTCAAVPS